MKKILKDSLILIFISLFIFLVSSCSDNKVTIRFENYDGTLLEEYKLDKNSIVKYIGDTPIKEQDAEFTYEFIGWLDGTELVDEFSYAVIDKTYQASFEEILRSYDITWNVDGNITVEEYNYGDIPSFKGTTDKDSTSDKDYVFIGWDKEISPVVGQKTYIAQYSDSLKQYNIRFENEDGTELITILVNYGEVPAYPNSNPTKDSTVSQEFVFAGWDKDLVSVSKNETYKATYTASVRKYEIRFENYNGKELKTYQVEYNKIPIYEADTPLKEMSNTEVFTFNGWDSELTKTTEDKTYVATYTPSTRKYEIRFEDYDGVELETILLEYNEMPTYDSNPPVREMSNTEIFTFNGWNNILTNVTEDKTYVASYNVETRYYDVTYYDNDGTTILYQTQMEYEADGFVLNKVDAKNDNNNLLIFNGWYSDLENGNEITDFTVLKDEKYYARYVSLSGLGTLLDPALVNLDEELSAISYASFWGEDFSNYYFKLNSDIDLTNTNFYPIGSLENENNIAAPFAGNFDGNNYTITLNQKAEMDLDYAGLFGNNTGEISSLIIKGEVYGLVAGGVAAINNGTIKNSINKALIVGINHAGGITGKNYANLKYNIGIGAVKLPLINEYAYELDGTSNNSFGMLVGTRILGDTVYLAESVWDGSLVADSFESGDGTVNDPFIIKTAAQLKYLQTLVSDDNNQSGIFFKLVSNIDLANFPWTGIGANSRSETSSFSGNFDGNGHAIFNLEVTGDTAGRNGLFGRVNNGLIENIVVQGNVSGSGQYYGLIAGALTGSGSIANSVGIGTVETTINENRIGGITGFIASGSISDSTVFGKVSGNYSLAGIVGYVNSNDNGIVSNSNNYAKVEVISGKTGGYHIGGIVGMQGTGSLISESINYGSVSGIGSTNGGVGGVSGTLFGASILNSTNYGDVSGITRVGGITGDSRHNAAIIEDVVNKGEVSGEYSLGGIVGYGSNGTLSKSDNYGIVRVSTDDTDQGYHMGGIVGMCGSNFSVSKSNNYGSVIGYGQSVGGVGGIAGSLYSTSILESSNYGTVSGTSRVGGIVGFIDATDGLVKECINHEDATITTLNDNVGGIVGYNNGSIQYCENYANYLAAEDAVNAGYIVGNNPAGSEALIGNINHYIEE